jgi:putative acetyltransferase
MVVREESVLDTAAIRLLHRAAFGGDAEGRLVDRLRGDGKVVASLVAEEDKRVVGHILFSDIRIETPRGILLGAALAPLGVLPDWQRRGIGSVLVREGLDLSRERHRVAAIVVGEPSYYSRFGFSSALAKNLRSKYSDVGPYWMALELETGALQDGFGMVRYPPAFDEVEA